MSSASTASIGLGEEYEEVQRGRRKKGKKDGGGSTEAKAVGSSRWTPYALLTPGFLWLAIFFVVPTITLFFTSLYVGGGTPTLFPDLLRPVLEALAATGERRSFLEDGDEVTFHGRCERDGFVPIGFGVCTGTLLPAHKPS